MAADHLLHVSFKAIMVLSVLLLPSSPLASQAAAVSDARDDLSSETLYVAVNDAKKPEEAMTTEEKGHGFICRFTRHFRIRFFGVVIECPESESPKLKPQSADGPDSVPVPAPKKSSFAPVHNPPVTSALISNGVVREASGDEEIKTGIEASGEAKDEF